MRRRLWSWILPVALVTLMAPPSHAQQAPLAGTWEFDLMVGRKGPDGGMVPGTAKARLTITEVGDSLVAVLEREAVDDTPARPPARMATRRGSGSEATFTQESLATLSAAGDERATMARTTWTFKAEGDVLAGTMAIRLEGVGIPDMAPRSFKGRRLG